MKAGQKARAKGAEILARRSKVARLYLQACPIREIAQILGIGKSTIGRDLKIIESEWRTEQRESFDAKKQQELAKILNEERETWIAWNRSKKMNDHQVGDPRFLSILDRLRDRRCQILGLYAPQKRAFTDADGEDIGNWALLLPIGGITTEEWMAQREESLRNSGAIDVTPDGDEGEAA